MQRKSGRTGVTDPRLANAMLMMQVESNSEGQSGCDTSAYYNKTTALFGRVEIDNGAKAPTPFASPRAVAKSHHNFTKSPMTRR